MKLEEKVKKRIAATEEANEIILKQIVERLKLYLTPEGLEEKNFQDCMKRYVRNNDKLYTLKSLLDGI